jgi:hypothetical protein
MKKLASILFSLFCASGGYAQVNLYAASAIPDSLKKDANVVIREELIKFTVKDINSAKYEVHQVYTILNEQGKRYLNFNEFSYEFRVLDDAEIKVYDAFGKKINAWSKKEMTSLNYGEGLVPEGKLTYFNVSPPGYPLTVEINYSVRYKGLFSYPANYFQHSWQSVQQAVFEVEVPADLSFRYKMVNNNYQPVIEHNGNKDRYHWEVSNLAAFKPEKYVGTSDNYLPYVLTAPNKFQLNEYDGDMTSWKNFGVWYNKVYLKTSGLKEERKLFYVNLVKDAKTDVDKARILYNYLQNNMRYVSIQLGIGGLKPFPAGFVDDKKYGDCKALSNYLKSALDAVSVKSNIVIIEGGMEPGVVFEDFPAHYFNHVILCIPRPADSIWLECTSTTLPFAQLGPFTENRKAMMITDEGGVLVNTPVSDYESNTEVMNTFIEVNGEGGAKVQTNYSLTGEGRNELLMQFHDLKEDEKRKFFINHKEWKQPDNFAISNSKNKANPYLVNAVMDYEKLYSFNAGTKLFFEPRLYPVFDEEVPESEKRMGDYYFTCPYQAVDTTVYKFPPGFGLENIPHNLYVQFSFAVYTSNYKWDAAAHTLTSVALLQIKDRVIKASDYSKLVNFKKQVMADMHEKIVMKRE